MQNNIFITCIIPVYNGAKYISQCLNSIVQQNLDNLEIIIVNDASIDGTLTIIEEYKKKYSWIRIINNSYQQGVSISRNLAIKEAKGKFIHFIDGDDEIIEDVYTKLFDILHNSQIDILVFNYYKVHKYGNSKEGKYMDESINYGLDDNRKIQILKSGVTVWNKIYGRSFLLEKQIQFLPKTLYEDIPFFWEAIIQANNIKYSNIFGYLYYTRKFSIMNSRLSLQKALQIINIWLYIYGFLQKKSIYETYKNLYIDKCLKTLIEFSLKVEEQKRYVYDKMVQNFSFISKQDIKKAVSLRKYMKYRLFLSGRYALYKICFFIFKLVRI